MKNKVAQTRKRLPAAVEEEEEAEDRPPFSALRTLLVFGLAQALGWGLALGTGLLGAGLVAFTAVQAGVALGVARLFKSPVWWLWIQAGFGPLVILALSFGIPSYWYLLGFALLALVYGASPRTRVPLYLSNPHTIAALAESLGPEPGHFLDAGCGTGTVIAALARKRPDWQFTGIEQALIPWLLAHWRTRRLPNAEVIRGDYFVQDWSIFDCVYVFLSPAPMAEVEIKAQEQLFMARKKTIPFAPCLISNSFPLPTLPPTSTRILDDRRRTQLYIYRALG
jgi:hypothetical protein